MLQRITAANNVVFYRSPRLHAAGVPHAFSTRIGGVSAGPFESLNLGNPSGVAEQDSAGNIAENYRRLHAAIGCEDRRRVFAHQIHGNVVLNPATAPQTDSIHGGCEIGKGDALFTTDPALLLSVRTADCVPVLLASADGKQVAACHAGWRGVVAGVVPEALKRFENPAGVIAAIGPAIGFDAFEVGPEVADEFERFEVADSFDASAQATDSRLAPRRQKNETLVRRLTDGKARINLQRFLELQLNAAGVTQIDLTDRCTVTHADGFFSHRRDRGISGRMAAVIGARS